MINKAPPLSRDDNGDPDIKGLNRGFTHQGSTLDGLKVREASLIGQELNFGALSEQPARHLI